MDASQYVIDARKKYLSRLTGNKKALIIGISYRREDKDPVDFCIDSAKAMELFVKEKFGFEDIVLLTDETENTTTTRERIEHEMRMLVKGAKANDSLLFYFNGHGTRQYDMVGDEWDYFDECLSPVDRKTNGVISDDFIYETLVRKLPKGCRLTAVVDACHSGTIFDLPFEYDEKGEPVKPCDLSLVWDATMKFSYLDFQTQIKEMNLSYKLGIHLAREYPPKDVVVFSA